MDCSHGIQVVPLEEKHVLDFLSWTDYDDPLFAMYNFSEDEDTVGDWFRWKTKGRRDRYFAILMEGRAAGYMGLKGISRISRSAELGIVLDRAVIDGGVGRAAITWLLNHGFFNLGLERIFLEVLPWNGRAIHLYESLGFEALDPVYRPVELSRQELMDSAFDPYRKYIRSLRQFTSVLVQQMEMTKGRWRRGI